jgi:hypothetical protein
MSSTDFEVDPLLEKIHSRGYWRVLIRPSRHEENRIPSLSKCWRVLEDSVVQLRGWDYPHVHGEHRINRQHWIESSVDWEYGHIEYWRFYQSAQFIHHFAMREDYEAASKDLRGLDFINTVYTFTEIFEFAARLAAKELLSPSAVISVELHGCDGRQVISWDRGRYLRNHVSAEPAIRVSRVASDSALLAESPHFAIEASMFVFERFNWMDAPTGMLEEEQARLLERRL